MTYDLTRRQLMAGTAAFAGTTLAGLTLAGRSAFAQDAPTSIAVRVRRDPEVLDPAFRTSLEDGQIIRSIYQNLVTFDTDTGELVMDAAESFEQVSDTEYAFRLKPGQMFTGGYGEMTAEDVKFSFERFSVTAAEGEESPYASDWTNLTAVEVDDTYSGRIILDAPRASLMTIAIADSSGCIVCKKAVEELGVEHNISPVGSNALMVTAFERQRQVTLARNPDYDGEPAGFEEIAVRLIQDPKTTELALRSGELDFSDVDARLADDVANVEGLEVETLPGLANIWLGMNTQKAPFDDLKVRQAVRLALDVDQMLLAGYDGKLERANTLVMPQVLGHWEDAPVYQRDVEQARALLEEAGHPNGFTARITVLNQPAFTNMALVAQALLAEIGITLEVDSRDGGTYWSSGQDAEGENLDMFILRFNGKLDPNFVAQWFTTDQVGVWNWQRWENPEFDALLAQAAVETDEAARAELIIEAQKLMDESAAFVWLSYDANFIARRDWLEPALLPSGIDWKLYRFEPA